MPNVNFYLKKAEPTTGNSLIYLQFKYSNFKLIFSFGQTIEPRLWNKNKQRVKSNNITTEDGKYALNDLLDTLQKLCEKTYHNELKNGVPAPGVIKLQLQEFMNSQKVQKDKPTLYKLIERFTNNEIHYKGATKRSSTITKYKTVLKHLQEFEKATKYKIDFNTITLDFFYRFLTYLKGKSLSQNTIAKIIQIIKTFMNEAVELGLTSNLQFRSKKFTASWENTEAVYLSEEEINQIYLHDFSTNKRLQEVRDLFVFGCHVGLRYSDYSQIKPQNIIQNGSDHYIKIKTQKTGEQVVIPCNPVVQEIFAKYKANANQLPPSISNQKFNDYIKDVCKEAGLKEKGRLLSDPDKELWQCISSHTARRSFATNLYLEGYPPIEIMKITGHRTEKAFLTYIRVTQLDAAHRLSQHMTLKWIEKLSQAG